MHKENEFNPRLVLLISDTGFIMEKVLPCPPQPCQIQTCMIYFIHN